MEFPFDVSRVLRDSVTVWDRNAALQLSKDNNPRVREILDRMGQASAKAQGLNIPVTNFNVLLQSPDQRCYVFTEGKQVVGIIKVGRKKLFIRNELDVHKEISPMCVLDFYVHESRQRTGRGKMLFEAMMERENIQPWKLAYDRPSKKFVNFLQKHYGLVDFTPQANNFVVFKRYFEDMRSTSRNEQANASVSMRPLTAHKRRNSYDERVHGQQAHEPLSYYTPQKPQHRPDHVTPLSLNQLPKNGHNPFSVKSTTPQQPQQQQQQSQRQQQTQQPSNRSNRSDNQLNRQDSRNNFSTTNNYDTGRRDYNNNDDRADYDDRENYNNHHDDEYKDRDSGRNHYEDHENENGYDDNIAPEDYANDRAPPRNDANKQSYASPTFSRTTPLVTTSSNYGSHSPIAARNAASPTPYRPGPNSTTFNRSYNNSALSGSGVIFGSEYSADPQPVRGRSPARQRSESPFAETASLTSTSTRQRSNSLDRSHVPPKGLGTLGSFNQSFTHPVKFEKDLADPPQRKTPYKDYSVLPPKREVTPTRSPAYRLGPASTINSREMDHLENSMRNALSTIDASEKRVNLLEEGGYRAVSPEPKAPTRQDYYQAPQARSIFSSVQPTGSPMMRSVSPAKFNNRDGTGSPEPSSFENSFSKTDYHKKFHSENPNLMSSPPQAVRVHPNSRSRQSPFPS